MNLWRKFSNLIVEKTVTLKKSATLTQESGSTATFSGTLDAAGTFKVGGTAVTASAAELNIMDGVLATAAEINAACDVSTRIVNTTATTLTITAATHSGKVVTVNSAAPIAITLPAASGSGNEYSFVIGTAATATAHTIKVANTTDIMAGVSVIAQTDTAQVNGFLTTATDDTISLNGTTKGGLKGDEVFIRDIASGVFQVRVVSGASGTVVTPFSASV